MSTSSAPLLRRDERVASILAAGARAFARTGFAATSMEDVAAEVGVTKLILYRHFPSKEALYRAVLDRVADRVAEEFVAGLATTGAERRGFIIRSLLTAARENPDGFRLLLVHAAREPRFAEKHRELRAGALAVADELVGDMIPDPRVKAFATRIMTDYTDDAVLTWLDVGDPARDEEFVALATDGLVALFLAWADPDRIPADLRRTSRSGAVTP